MYGYSQTILKMKGRKTIIVGLNKACFKYFYKPLWCHMSVLTGTQEAEVGKSLDPNSPRPRERNKTLPQ
jgi:hypothetical protein